MQAAYRNALAAVPAARLVRTTRTPALGRVHTPIASPPLPVSACAGACVQSHRSFHASSHRGSLTGIAFSPVPPAELKVAQWMKQQEIMARRKALHRLAEQAWALQPREDWTRLTLERSAELLQPVLADPTTPPSDWECNEFLAHTLKTKCAWRYEEVVRERRDEFEKVLAAVMADLRKESEAYRHGTLTLTKNELTRKLIAKMGKLPSAAEVESAWQDRHQLPAIEWIEDAI